VEWFNARRKRGSQGWSDSASVLLTTATEKSTGKAGLAQPDPTVSL
jgi:hypothetical protein